MGLFNFTIEGPGAARKRAMEERELAARTRAYEARAQIEEAEASKIDPSQPQNMSKIRDILTQYENSQDPLERRALEASLGNRFGTVKTDMGDVPAFLPQDEIRQRQAATFMKTSRDLADVEEQIQLAEQSGDMRLANAMRTQRDTYYKNAKDNFKKVPFDKLDELVNRRSFLDSAEKVATLLQEKDSSSLYGPMDSFLGNIGAATGIMSNPKYVALTQAFAATRNALLKELAGSAVTPSEASRQLESIGDPARSDFGDKFMAFYNQSRTDFYNKLQTLNDSGYQIPEKLIVRSSFMADGQRLGQQGQAKPDASAFQYDPRARRVIPGR